VSEAFTKLINALPGGEATGWMMVLIVGTLGAAFFAGAETGLYSVNRVRLRLRAARTHPVDTRARTLGAEVARLDRALPAMLLGFNLFSAMASLGLTALLTMRGYGEGALLWINALIVTPVTFVIVDSLPKELFRADADRLAYAAAPAVKLWRVLTTWMGLLPLVRACASLVNRLVARGKRDDPDQARAHIHALLKEGASSGVISPSQLALMDQAFSLRESDVRDEMIPWPKAVIIEAGWPRARVLDVLARHTASRFPLVDERGVVLGAVEHIDLCLRPEVPLRQLAKPVTVLSGDTPIRDALRKLAEDGRKLAVVVPGPGNLRPIGLVTMKDLIEPLTGELKAF
jgi:putative hemolysin